MSINYPALVFALVALSLIYLMNRRAQGSARAFEGMRLESGPKEILDEGERGLLYLYRPNCKWCARQKPIIEEIKATGKIPVVEVDISVNRELAAELRVPGTPTLVLVEGGVIKKYLVGFQAKEKLIGAIHDMQP